MGDSAELNPSADMLRILDEEPTGDTLRLCHTCGSCVSRCFLKDAVPGVNPRRLVRAVANGWEELALESPLLWTCTLCNRCTFDCPMGLRMDEVVRSARGVQAKRGESPSVLQDGVESALETGNVSMIPKDEFVETVEWLEEEMQEDLEDDTFRFPLDREGATYVFLPNPREINIMPTHLVDDARLFVGLGEPWTVASELSDVTNWGYFVGDPDATRRIATRVAEAVEALGAETLVLTECGHGFKVYARDLERWIGRRPGFRVVSILELVAEGVREGRIRLDPSKNPKRVTYHDPCNLGRKGGVFEPPREVLRASVQEFIEMWPNRMAAWCCGGGGGTDRVPEGKPIRMEAGRTKVEQILRTGAEVVATGCLSCLSNLEELKKHHGLKVEMASVVTLAARALELPSGAGEDT